MCRTCTRLHTLVLYTDATILYSNLLLWSFISFIWLLTFTLQSSYHFILFLQLRIMIILFWHILSRSEWKRWESVGKTKSTYINRINIKREGEWGKCKINMVYWCVLSSFHSHKKLLGCAVHRVWNGWKRISLRKVKLSSRGIQIKKRFASSKMHCIDVERTMN